MAHSEMCAHFSKSPVNTRRRIETNYLITLELCIDRKYCDGNRHSARCFKGNPRRSVRTQSVKSMDSLPKLSIIHGPRKRSSSSGGCGGGKQKIKHPNDLFANSRNIRRVNYWNNRKLEIQVSNIFQRFFSIFPNHICIWWNFFHGERKKNENILNFKCIIFLMKNDC